MELWLELALIALIYLLAGLVKGVIGFALPLVSVSLLSIFVPVEEALALNTIPLLVTNLWLALQSGDAVRLLRRYWWLIVCLAIGIFAGANIVVAIDERSLLLAFGVGVIVLSILERFRPPVRLPDAYAIPVGVVAGLLSGLFGGLVSAMAAPVAIYLTARKIPKDEFVASVGVIYTCGALFLIVGFGSVRILTLDNAPLSGAAAIPAVAGLLLGTRVRDSINQHFFQQLVLLGLVLVGLNMVRRAFL